MIFGHNIEFWIAVFGAAAVKIITGSRRSWVEAFVSTVTALFMAWVFTKPVVAWFGWDYDIYAVPTGALLALTSQSLLRFLIDLTPASALDLLKGWRGK